MPNTLSDIVTSWSSASFSGPFSGKPNPGILLKIPYAFGEKTCSNKVQETCRYDKKDLERRPITSFVDEVADDGSGAQAADDRKRE